MSFGNRSLALFPPRALSFPRNFPNFRINSQFARGAASRAAQFAANRFGRSSTLTRQRRSTRGGNGVTTQFDRARIYRKRRMPRFRRRRWRRFNRRVDAVSEKDLGSRTAVFNQLTNATHPMDTTGSGQHGVQIFTLYGLANAGFVFNNDVNEMSQDTDLGTTGKAIFKSAVLDMTMRNISAHGDTADNPLITLEVDVYELSCRTDLAQTGKAATLAAAFTEGATDTATIPGQATALSSASRGWTPWDFPSALSEYRIKIWKKTKYFISENQTFTYQVRDPRRHVLDKQRMLNPGENLPGVTRFIMFIYKPVPGYNYIAAPNNDTYGISFGVTRKYLYKIADKTQDYDMYNT